MSQVYAAQHFPTPYGQQQPMYPQQPPVGFVPPGYQQPAYQPQMQQPMYQPQQQAQFQPDKQAVGTAFTKFVVQAASSAPNNLTNQLYGKYANNQWNNNEVQLAINVAYAVTVANYRATPGIQAPTLYAKSVQDAYEILANLELQASPQLVQSLPQNVVQVMAQNLPALQGIVNSTWAILGQQPFQVSIPGMQVQTYNPMVQAQQFQGYQQQAPISHGISLNQPGMMQQHAPQQPANYGLSNARTQPIVPSATGPVTVKAVNVVPQGAGQRDFMSTARTQSFAPVNPVQQPHATQQAPQFEAPVVNTSPTHGVVETYSSPGIHGAMMQESAVFQQQNNHLLSALTEQALANIEPITDEEEHNLFNTGYSNNPANRPMPTFSEIFGHQTKPITEQVQTVADIYASAVQEAPQIITTHTAAMPGVSSSGLPDNWMYTEPHYAQPTGEFFDVMMKAKRNSQEPLPISYDKRCSTRLFRYKEDGSIEQKIVGVSMDRLKHDLSLLDTPMTAEIAMAMEPFTPLRTMPANEAVRIIRAPDATAENIAETLKESDIFVVSKPVVATSRQEGVMLSAASLTDIMENNPNKHGNESYIREARIVTSVANVEEFLALPGVIDLTADSKTPNIMELSETIRGIRHAKIMSSNALRKITDHMVDVINHMLTFDYGYAGELQLDKNDHFEDEVVDLIMWLNGESGDKEVIARINTNWTSIRSKLCAVLSGRKLTNMQAVLANRYKDVEHMDKVTANLILLETDYSITRLTKTSDELRIVGEASMFAVKESERPYLYQVMTGIKSRTDATKGVFTKHIVYTRDGVEMDFTLGGLGNGTVFIAGFAK